MPTAATLAGLKATDRALHAPAPAQSRPRAYFMDRLRTVATVLVVIHHCACFVDQVPAGLPFVPDPPNSINLFKQLAPSPRWQYVLASVLSTLNQSWFMGFFFLLAGACTPSSFKRKGFLRFIVDRAMRLLVPTLAYVLILWPASELVAGRVWSDFIQQPSVRAHVSADDWAIFTWVSSVLLSPWKGMVSMIKLDVNLFAGGFTGQMWFCVTLFWFSLVYACIATAANWARAAFRHSLRGSCKTQPGRDAWDAPAHATANLDNVEAGRVDVQRQALSNVQTTAGCVIAITVLTASNFVGGTLLGGASPTYLLIGYFEKAWYGQYIACFVTGLWAAHCDLLTRLPHKAGAVRLGVAAAMGLVTLVAPTAIAAIRPDAAHSTTVSHNTAGMLVALWSQTFAVEWSVGLLATSARWWNKKPGKVEAAINGAAFAAYVTHAFFITAFTAALAYVPMQVLPFVAIVSTLSVVAAFAPRTLATLAAPAAARVTPRLQAFYADTFLPRHASTRKQRTVNYVLMTVAVAMMVTGAAYGATYVGHGVLYGLCVALIVAPALCCRQTQPGDTAPAHAVTVASLTLAVIASLSVNTASLSLQLVGRPTAGWACLGAAYGVLLVLGPAVVAAVGAAAGDLLWLANAMLASICSARLYWSFLTMRVEGDLSSARCGHQNF